MSEKIVASKDAQPKTLEPVIEMHYDKVGRMVVG